MNARQLSRLAEVDERLKDQTGRLNKVLDILLGQQPVPSVDIGKGIAPNFYSVEELTSHRLNNLCDTLVTLEGLLDTMVTAYDVEALDKLIHPNQETQIGHARSTPI